MADTVRTGDRDDLGAEFDRLGGSAPGHVTEAGEGEFLALDVLASLLEEVLGEVEGAEAGSLRTEDGTAPGAATVKDIQDTKTATWIQIPSGWICGKNSKVTYVY